MSRLIIVFFVIGLCAGLASSYVEAQIVDLDKMSKIPRHSKMSVEDYKKISNEFTETPHGDKFLEYSIRLPEGWQKLGENEELSLIDVKKDSVPAATTEAPAKPVEDDPYGIMSLRGQKLEEDRVNAARKIELQNKNLDNGIYIGKEYSSVANIKDQQKVENLNTSLLGPVAKYAGPSDLLARSRLEIFAIQLTHGITTKNWFLNYILGRYYTLMGMEQINPNRIEAEYVLIEDSISYVVRTAAISNGPRMVLISYFVPEANWEKEKEMQQMAIDSFYFLDPEETIVDDKEIYGFLDLVKFAYPMSWRLTAPNVYSIENMSAKLISSTDGKTLDGEIDLNLISTELDTTLMKEVETLRLKLKERGFEIGKALPVSETYAFDKAITFSRVEAYEIKNTGRDFINYEYWLAIMVEDRYYYIVTMLTPGRSADFYTWARNTETFSGVIQSMMPQVAGETLDAAFMKTMMGIDASGTSIKRGKVDNGKLEEKKKVGIDASVEEISDPGEGETDSTFAE
ncbi:MAG: hypothetical protein HYS17_06890 [Micavibrio aeruginosavorus]|uniref:Uncharacterized protein n=1 Tax=Micavibrio aeruginosavorus TaxID=349221 RepID=A0A7T5UFK3_9BACT|nr:MAG: hypothetical protein HYS17_06890 [Micavibrio aeruginosavorus]